MQKFVMMPGIPVETATKVYRRYLKIEPLHTEEYIAYLKGKVSNFPDKKASSPLWAGFIVNCIVGLVQVSV